LFTGFIVTLICLIPIGIISFLLHGSQIGEIIIYILGAILIFIQYMVGYIFSAMTVYLIYGYLAEGDGRMDKAWAIIRRDGWDIASLAAASTAVNLLKRAAFLILPAMVIEDINLKAGIKRATQIIRDNLLLVGISTVGVKTITGVIGFFLGAVGVGLGFGVGLGIVSASQGAVAGWITGVTLGILIATPFILFATVLTTYTATAYHTCLYLWARQVERARQTGQPGEAVAPQPLAAVL
jgi:hypothetical protein